MFTDIGKMRLVDDEPATEDNLQFRFSKHAKSIANILVDNETETPFVIAINGEWGSGKTTFLSEIRRKTEKLDGKNNSLNIIDFNSWEYEKMDVFASLLDTISEKSKSKNLASAVILFACDSILRNKFGMSLDEAKSHFKKLRNETKSLKSKLSDIIGNKRTILFIDDLDRCNAENVLVMLENMKWFLTIKNVMVVMAVDMSKIEHAWELRYNNKAAKGIGRAHAEKMFQTVLNVPTKLKPDLLSYVIRLTNTMNILDDVDIRFFVNILPDNPRKIKHAVNLLQIELHNIDESYLDSGTDEKTYLRTLMAWIAISSYHRDIAKIVRMRSDFLIEAAIICSEIENRYTLKHSLEEYINSRKNKGETKTFVVTDRFRVDYKNMGPELIQILESCTSTDNSAYDILYEYGKIFKIEKSPKTGHIQLDYILEQHSLHSKTLKTIVMHSLM
ncbi:MAG: KAP family NTPase [Nitrosopumilus sp.]|nr:KAP family NTPase [Nitrosopumilus sp.]MDA7943066.1 KAP family NTPase [Nitrosopumilus sp.]